MHLQWYHCRKRRVVLTRFWSPQLYVSASPFSSWCNYHPLMLLNTFEQWKLTESEVTFLWTTFSSAHTCTISLHAHTYHTHHTVSLRAHTHTVSLHAHTYHTRLTPCTLTQSHYMHTLTLSHCVHTPLTTSTHHTHTISLHAHTTHSTVSLMYLHTPTKVSLHAHTTHSHCLTTCTHHTVSQLCTHHTVTVSHYCTCTHHTLTVSLCTHHTLTVSLCTYHTLTVSLHALPNTTYPHSQCTVTQIQSHMQIQWHETSFTDHQVAQTVSEVGAPQSCLETLPASSLPRVHPSTIRHLPLPTHPQSACMHACVPRWRANNNGGHQHSCRHWDNTLHINYCNLQISVIYWYIGQWHQHIHQTGWVFLQTVKGDLFQNAACCTQ